MSSLKQYLYTKLLIAAHYLFIALHLVGCGPRQFPVSFSPTNYSFTNPLVTPAGKRLIYLHGLRRDHTMLVNTPEYEVVTTMIINAGWQVIEFDEPYAEPELFADGGKS